MNSGHSCAKWPAPQILQTEKSHIKNCKLMVDQEKKIRKTFNRFYYPKWKFLFGKIHQQSGKKRAQARQVVHSEN
jgi:hypothetical protein